MPQPPRSRRAGLAAGAGFLAEALTRHAERFWSVAGIVRGLGQQYRLLPGEAGSLLTTVVRDHAACLVAGGKVLCAPARAGGWADLWTAVLAAADTPQTFDGLVAIVAGDAEATDDVVENVHCVLSVAAEQGLVTAAKGQGGETLYARKSR